MFTLLYLYIFSNLRYVDLESPIFNVSVDCDAICAYDLPAYSFQSYIFVVRSGS